MNESTYEEVKAIITITTPKAVRIVLRNGRHVWIPLSQVCNKEDLVLYSECRDEQVLHITHWLCEKLGLSDNGWY